MPTELSLRLSDTEHIDNIVDDPSYEAALRQPLQGITLGALGELVCWGAAWATQGRREAVEVIRGWATEHEPLNRSWRALRTPMAWSEGNSARSSYFEVHPVPRRHEVGSPAFASFQRRFGECLASHGFASPLARALSKALVEMADNVISHSGPDEYSQANGIVAFHVEERWMAYAVADTGRGVLASLQSAPRWQHLRTSREALHCAVREQATRRDAESGGGYQTVLRSLAEFNGFLRFRSGDHVLELRGTSSDLYPGGGPVPSLAGLQLVVHCSLDAAGPGERLLPPRL